MRSNVPKEHAAPRTDRIGNAVREVWGFESLRPLQREAIEASLAERDSLVVMPTGGGKSLCYQVPPLVSGRLCVVVSPLIALMDDQVAGLTMAGYPAGALHGQVGEEEAASVRARAESGELRLLLVAPERLLTSSFLNWLKRLERTGGGVESFAIDEAHCISQWGHDFRPEYRRLADLRRQFPSAALHAYTATATERVREDIIAQLGLRDPVVLVGRFDRPNLTYRVAPRIRLEDQAIEALRRHEGQAAIVYCISRKDTESLAGALRAAGIDARAYHAGMGAEERRRVQDYFRNERLDVVVATVAFGMGIDRGDVRLVLHAAMPKTVEHYQQETGRAGRDGLPAECVLLYSATDAVRWRQLMERAAAEAMAETGEAPSGALEAQLELLGEMQRFSAGARCRHTFLSEYFGQAYEAPGGEVEGCGACDVCLSELEEVEGATVIAQKILSCVARVGQAFGAAHVIAVLRGANSAKVRERGHDQLSVYGLLREEPKDVLAAYVGQLVDQELLAVEPGQYPILKLTAGSMDVLRGNREARLVRARSVDAHRERSRERAAAGAGPRGGRGVYSSGGSRNCDGGSGSGNSGRGNNNCGMYSP